MSYSRFGSSYWYTFWACAPEGVTETRNNAILEVMLIQRFTAEELRDDIERCLKCALIASEERVSQKGGDKPTEADMQELREIFGEFLKDIDDAYPATDGATPKACAVPILEPRTRNEEPRTTN